MAVEIGILDRNDSVGAIRDERARHNPGALAGVEQGLRDGTSRDIHHDIRAEPVQPGEAP